MSQYSSGLSSPTNGSATVTGTNTLWLANVTAGDSFTIASSGVVYDVASVDSDTQITLSVAYAGATASGAVYAIGTGFTVPDNFPEMSQGDIETATIFTRAMRKIQGKFSSILAGGANANFTAMPQVGGDPIVESGSNADGEWTRFADGTQVSRRTFTSVVITNGNFHIYYWTFPIAFSEDPIVVTSASENFSNNVTSVSALVESGASLNPSTTRIIIKNTTGSSVNVGLNAYAIGNWK